MSARAFLVFLLLLVAPALGGEPKHSYRPKDGYVPDAATAIRIAEAVWLPVYGPSVLKERPYAARHDGAVWTVTGALPKGAVGGVAVIEISQMTGEILRLSHGK